MIVFGVASTFGTVAFATEVSTDPQQPQQTQQQVIGRTPESAPPAVEPTPDPTTPVVDPSPETPPSSETPSEAPSNIHRAAGVRATCYINTACGSSLFAGYGSKQFADGLQKTVHFQPFPLFHTGSFVQRVEFLF